MSLYNFQQKWSCQWIYHSFFFYSYQYEGIRKPAYAFVVCSNKILTSSMQRNALKKSYFFFFTNGVGGHDASSALKFLYFCHFSTVYSVRFPKEKWIGYIILLSEKRPPTAMGCLSLILTDKPRLRNIYKTNCPDSVCFSRSLTVHIKYCVYLHGSIMGPKNLKAVKLHVLLWEIQMRLVRLFPETCTPRSLKPHKPQRKPENTECGT